MNDEELRELMDHPNIMFVNTSDGEGTGRTAYPTSIEVIGEMEKLHTPDDVMEVIMSLDPIPRKILLMRQGFIRESTPEKQALDGTAVWIGAHEMLWLWLGRPVVYLENEELVRQLYAMEPSKEQPTLGRFPQPYFEMSVPYGMELDGYALKPSIVEYISNEERAQLNKDMADYLSEELGMPPFSEGLTPLEVVFSDSEYPTDSMWAVSWLCSPKSGGVRVRSALPISLVAQAVQSPRDFTGCIKAFNHSGEEHILDEDDEVSYRLSRLAVNLLHYINNHPEYVMPGMPDGHTWPHSGIPELAWTVRGGAL